ncbi:hypothetical protein ACFQX6_34700 [Streptosporangium lutulentum]
MSNRLSDRAESLRNPDRAGDEADDSEEAEDGRWRQGQAPEDRGQAWRQGTGREREATRRP